MSLNGDGTNGRALAPPARVARWSAYHPWWVLGLTFLALVAGVLASMTLDVQLFVDDDLGVGESGRASDVLNDKFPEGSDPPEQLVISHPLLEVDDPAFRSRVDSLVAQVRALPGVVGVLTFYESRSDSLVSADRHVLRTEIDLEPGTDFDDDVAAEVLEAVAAARASAEGEGFTIAVAGIVTTSREVTDMVEEDFSRILFISLGLGLIIMLLAFRALVAALIPLFMAVWAIIIATGLAAVISQFYSLVETYNEMILLLGMAVGIDYSLFIVSRFRHERELGREKLDAITFASMTTGRAVFYAGVTVLVSLAGLMLTNHPVFISLALGAMLVVFVTIIGSLTFLPAVLAVLGDNVNRLQLPLLRRLSGNGMWGAITDRVMARPLLFAGVAGIGLIAIAAPAADLTLGFPTGSKAFNDAVSGKQAIRLLEDHFTSGLTDPAYVVVSASDVTTPEVQGAMGRLIDRLEADPDSYFGPFDIVLNSDNTALYVLAPISGETGKAEESVNALRDEIIPTAFAGVSAEVAVTGFAAVNEDFRELMFDKAPYVFGFVLGISFLLLLVMFRSVVIPVKSILLNLLSVGAAYGVLVMVFQWGWGIGILGSESSGVILSWLPLFLFAILFGLSMDYHMLLLNRVKESYDLTHDNEGSVAMGIKLTAGQITSAAAVMVGVFSAFALGRDVGLQQFGIGLGVSVFIDATVIRSVLLPATMKLLGDWNWYLPHWLEWLPKISAPEREPEPAG